MKKILCAILIIVNCQLSIVNCQNKTGNWCGFDQKLQQQLKANSALQKQLQQYEENLSNAILKMELEKTPAGVLQIVPVVVHVIHDNGKGNISEAQIKDGIRVLNEDYVRLNADSVDTRSIFKPQAGVADFEFRLAQIDPNGNPTNGIVRINSPLTYDADDGAKTLSYWNSSKFFNIWLVNSIEGSGGGSTILGYAQFPGFGSWNTYGVIMLHTQFGRFGTSNSDGRTATHEVGHCLNLYHTFQGGCGGSNCSTGGDRVCDTPPTANETFSCSDLQNLCSNDVGGQSPYTTDVVDQIENYMSYDACQNMFTTMQVSRMKAAINANTQLQNLISPANITATGVDLLHAADFYSDKTVVCANQTVKFTDASYYGQNSWSWNFNGGTPANSSTQHPEVVYSTPGLYDVALTVSDGMTNKSKTSVSHILVVTPDSNYLPFYESFEGISVPNYRWYIANLDNDSNVFQQVNGIGFSGNSCVKLNNSGNVSGNRDELIVGSFDLKNMSAVSITFKTAYAQKDTSTKDKLMVYVSTNCGASWAPRYSKIGSAFASAPNQTSAFTPNDVAQWKSHTATLISSMLVENVLVKFVFESDEGNNFYIDDINITGSSIPLLKSPVNYALGLSDTVKTDWFSVVGVSMYQHEMDTTPNFNSPLLEFGQYNYISGSSDSLDTEHTYSGLLHNQKYYWRVRTITGTDTSAWSAVWNFTVSETGVGIESQTISSSAVEISIYPNPVSQTSIIFVSLAQSQKISIEIYDVLGRKTAAITNKQNLPKGENKFMINKNDFSKGLYFLKLTSDKNSVVRKFVVE